jgi:hypothetical protein
VNYKNGRRHKSVPLAWRALVTTHEGLIDRPKDLARPERGWNERGNDQTGKPWVDAKAWAVARVLDDHMGAEGTCWLSYATIAAQARISRTAVKDGAARLEGAGLLGITQRRVGPRQSDTNLFHALGVGAHRPGGRGDSAHTPGRTAPQSPQEVNDPFGLSEPSGSAEPGEWRAETGAPRVEGATAPLNGHDSSDTTGSEALQEDMEGNKCLGCLRPTGPNVSMCDRCGEEPEAALARYDERTRRGR